MGRTDFENLRNLFHSSDIIGIQTEIIALIKGLSRLQSVNCKFYFHPLGFVYSVLHTFSDGESIRLHIWNKKFYNTQPLLDIHGHYYKVNSYVFRGCVINQLYNLNESGGVKVNQYKGSYTPNGDRILTKADKCWFVIETSKTTHCQGELYSIGHDEIHSGGSSGNLPVCTVVYTQEPGEKHPLVFGKGDFDEEICFRNVEVPDEILRGILDELNV